MADLTHVKGLSDLQKLLDTLAPKMEANVMRGALRAGAKVVLEEAKQNVPVDQGILRDGLKISTGIKKGVVKVSIKAKGKHGYLAHWMEYGTKPHKIFAKTAKGLMLRPNARASSGFAKRWVSHDFVESVDHPGISPRPFMRPALDSQAGQALMATGEYIKARLAKKHGLDTSDITIGDDEE